VSPTALNANFTAVETAVNDNHARIAQLEAQIAALQAVMQLQTDAQGHPAVVFSGVNVHINNGIGWTGSINGRGNLIVGYDEPTRGSTPFCSNGQFRSETSCINSGNSWLASQKTGSHHVVIGPEHNYSQGWGFVAGFQNTVNASGASILGGDYNMASGTGSTVTAGIYNKALGVRSSVSGGVNNTAFGYASSVSGGRTNVANGMESSVCGGLSNNATGDLSSVSGGYSNTAFGESSSVSSGYRNLALGLYSSVTGGTRNSATGNYSSVSGGYSHLALGTYDWIAGGLLQDQ
jgi:trimeric autotransporter adhesin